MMPSLSVNDELLVAYVDGELDDASKQHVEDLMARDAAVRRRVAMFQRSAEMLLLAVSGPEYTQVPAGLAVNAARILKPEARHRRASWLAIPMAAAIAGLIIGNAVLPRNFGIETSWAAESKLGAMLGEVAEYHAVFVRETEHLVEVPASRRDHIEAWLGDRVRYPFVVPDLASLGLAFAGARLLAINGNPVAQLMYVDGKGVQVALCVGFVKNALDASLQSAREGDFEAFGWAQGNHLFVAVGPQGNPELASLAQTLPRLLRPT